MIRPYLSYARNRAGIETQRLRLSLQPSPTALNDSPPSAALEPDANILCLCYGNICRSPLAERYLRNGLAERGIDGISVDSAGLRTTAGRKSPSEAVQVADEWRVDLSDHRSKPVTADLIEASDVVFVMDLLNYHHLRQGFGDQGEKTRFLGVFGNDGYEITDPYGEGIDRYRSLYGQVIRGADGFLDALERER
ncbi:low molecular weight phosphotyrosine protein phosphatase [Halorubrum sp. DTA46]|uniref:arsenate reductase/protein-tyrosine-phosphatase family protein n=1 Tax=Halorubrum sp. DTA46 TaxID=3402162 RepID=UPI003AB0D2E2